MIHKTRKLQGRLLDLAMVTALGTHVWARNMSKRTGDTWDQKDGKSATWPIGARCLIKLPLSPLPNPPEQNSLGWAASDGSEPFCRGSLYDVPKYDGPDLQFGHAQGGSLIFPLLPQFRVELECGDGENEASAMYDGERGPRAFGRTPQLAVSRAILLAVVGETITLPDIPKEFLK